MFDQVLDSLKKATDSTLMMQRERFARWGAFWPGLPVSPPNWAEEAQKVPKRWAETVRELGRNQRASLEGHFQVGMRNLESAFQLAEAKDVEDLRKRTVELWRKTIDCLRQLYEAQLRDLERAAGTWTQLMTKG
jgi:hypothetical protein